MPPTACIVTDSTAQLPQPDFAGSELVHVVPLTIQLNGRENKNISKIDVSQLPATADKSLSPMLLPVPEEKLTKLFLKLSQKYDEIIAIFASSHLNPTFLNAQAVAEELHGRVNILTIDSQTLSLGLGLMVEAAAEALSKGARGSEVERQVRSLIPRVYTILCTPGLSYLYYNGILDIGQALIGEKLGVFPIFGVEEGILTPLEKVRNHRYALDFFREFVEEFDNLQYIALLQNVPVNPQDTQYLKTQLLESFPNTPFMAHPINPSLAALFGPSSLGLFVVEESA
jgi:DegV family protein with EDD domain